MKPQQRSCELIKIKSPFIYEIQDTNLNLNDKQSSKKHSIKPITIQLQPQKDLIMKGQFFYHLIPDIMVKKNMKLTYRLIQQKMGKFIGLNEQVKKGYLYLNGQNILNLYKQAQEVPLSNEVKEYSAQQIIQCYVIKVQSLKLVMLNLQNLKIITFYFSQFKLVRPNNIHPKQSWQIAQKYLTDKIQGDFVQIKINGTEIYRQEMNVYGQILRTKNGDDIKEILISQGYVELSKNAHKYLAQQMIIKYEQMTKKAKQSYKGLWGHSQNKQFKKSSNQAEQLKYKKWQSWLNEKNDPKIKSLQDQSKQVISQLKKINPSMMDFNKGKTLLGVSQLLFLKVDDKKNLKNLHEIIKILSQIFVQIQITLMNNNNNMQFLKFYSKCLTFCIFYLEKINQFVDPKSKQVFPSSTQMQKILKTVFKTCYIGNQTFNQRFFGKKKQTNYENFSFDSAYLNGGISSYSEQSDYDDIEPSKLQNKQSKKIASAQTKIRINSTYLISLIFKFFPNIVESQWQICARSNILTNDFFQHLKKQKISADSTQMSESQRKELSLLLKNNFGDPSLLLLTIFQRNIKVRTNALNCIFNMIINFQGKKMINTTESVYIEKLLKSTKSSYIPKSYIIFSGLKNTLYFLLFTLKYEKNLEIIEITFKTLCELCNQCSLLDKLQFEDGMKLLMQNYIQPVLNFPWTIPELQELKLVCIRFLSVLVGTQKRWDQIQTNYLLISGKQNINLTLLEILQSQDLKKAENILIFEEIVKYFTKLPKQYFESIFFDLRPSFSVWKYLSQKCLEKKDTLFSSFISEIFKFNFDQIKMEQDCDQVETDEIDRNKRTQVKKILNKNEILVPFLQKFICQYTFLTSTQNYINLISILTNIEYKQWSKKQQNDNKLQNSKEFIYHLFVSLTGKKIKNRKNKLQFPSIKQIQQNSLVRVHLIKLIGYLSFCEEFQTQEIIVPSIDLLLQFSKKYKSVNTVVKITWALSNWTKVNKFITCIKKEQIQNSINYLIQQASSDKQKIASNSTRGIGFFMNQTQSKDKLEQLLKKCRTSIINNLEHAIIKVRTNSTKTLRSIVNELKGEQISKISILLQQNILKNNYHLQSETLMLIKQIGSPIEQKRLMSLYLTILKNLLNQSQLEYQFSQIKAIKQLRKIILAEVIEFIGFVPQHESIDLLITIYAYLVDCYNEEKNRNEPNQILQKGQEKGEEVQKLIFNIKNKIIYNQENAIATQTTLKGFSFTAKKSDIQLIEKIRQSSQQRQKYTLCSQWYQLQSIQIQQNHVSVGNFCT